MYWQNALKIIFKILLNFILAKSLKIMVRYLKSI